MGWRRRYCPRPIVIAVVVAVCVFYQCLTLLWKSTSWTIKDAVDRHTDLRDLSAKEDCLDQWDSIWKMFKDYEEKIRRKHDSNINRQVLLYGHPLFRDDESALYRKILAQLGHTVLQIEDIKSLKTVVNHNLQFESQYILFYIPSNKSTEENCEEKGKLVEIPQLTKVNIIPRFQHILCKKQRISKLIAHCPEKKRAGASVIFLFSPMTQLARNIRSQHFSPSSDSPLVRIFVLITSSSPLRAYIHSTAMVQDHPNKPFSTMKLQHFFEEFFQPQSSSEAFNTLKEMISKLLLTLEGISEAAATGQDLPSRCNKCFQLLTFDIGYSSASPPCVHEVKESFDFHNGNEKDQIAMETILQDVLTFIVHTKSFSFVEVLQYIQNHPAAKIYPSTSATLKCYRRDLFYKTNNIKQIAPRKTKQDLLTAVMEYLEISNDGIVTKKKNAKDNYHASSTPSAGFKPISGNIKAVNCSDDNDTLSYISHIFSNPPLDLTPKFNPNIKEYYAELPFDVVMVEIGAEPAHCKSQVHLDDREGPRTANYPLGLGSNLISIHVTDNTKPSPVLLRSYRITVHREDRPSMPLFDHHSMCGFVQDCSLIIYEKEPCGLQNISDEFSVSHGGQRRCNTGDAKGQWVVPCLTCTDNRTCDWRAITWQPYHCYHPVLQRLELQKCVKDRKILFIGDSTNRGMMYYLIERVNGTLQSWEKTHDEKLFENVNYGRTNITYLYYPQFWIDIRQRPTFEEALEHLLERSKPLKNTNQTVLVVGGVQWLNSDHLQIIHSILKRKNLLNILVIIKSIGMGFHLPVPGIRSLSSMQIRQLANENDLILKTAKHYGYEVVDTFSITMGRHKDFLRGKCACHYHEVVKTNKRYRTNPLKSYNFGHKNFYQVPDKLIDMKSRYHVQGPVNQVYSEILLNRICT
ncbi:cadherin-like and PC-esterase domain-containing protein 1 [Gastrophryne carolinensis]